MCWENFSHTVVMSYRETLDDRPLRPIAICDDVTTCECCGKANLKCTVLLSDGTYNGRTCAALILRGSKKPADVTVVVKAAEKEMQRLRDIESAKENIKRYEEMQAAGHARYLIGGKPIGAELSYLIAGERRRLAIAEGGNPANYPVPVGTPISWEERQRVIKQYEQAAQ